MKYTRASEYVTINSVQHTEQIVTLQITKNNMHMITYMNNEIILCTYDIHLTLVFKIWPGITTWLNLLNNTAP